MLLNLFKSTPNAARGSPRPPNTTQSDEMTPEEVADLDRRWENFLSESHAVNGCHCIFCHVRADAARQARRARQARQRRRHPNPQAPNDLLPSLPPATSLLEILYPPSDNGGANLPNLRSDAEDAAIAVGGNVPLINANGGPLPSAPAYTNRSLEISYYDAHGDAPAIEADAPPAYTRYDRNLQRRQLSARRQRYPHLLYVPYTQS